MSSSFWEEFVCIVIRTLLRHLSEGKISVAIWKILHFKHHQFLIELKYLKKEQKGDLPLVVQEAKEQVWRYYAQDKVLQSKEMLHLLAVVIVKDKVFAEEVKI
ncbi:MAG: PD-(D/E)XK nuclease domain-containing protein [Raineya sp.]|nr:PD-(D/E)XK nuclease domain-containing protein [Raineya sp.]